MGLEVERVSGQREHLRALGAMVLKALRLSQMRLSDQDFSATVRLTFGAKQFLFCGALCMAGLLAPLARCL